ncbi:DUF6185 family protein [Sorangium sp. So ce321]|uniref:DUF6185 family protein n=1 Tax=Sorangium sp. So ce321 TaxID=3133300 RepID=UPI003F6434D7
MLNRELVDRERRKSVWAAVRWIAAALLLFSMGGLSAALLYAVDPKRSPVGALLARSPEPSAPRASLSPRFREALQDPPSELERDVAITISPTQIEVEVDFVAPASHALARAVAQGIPKAEAALLVDAMVGVLSERFGAEDAREITWTVLPAAQTMAVHLRLGRRGQITSIELDRSQQAPPPARRETFAIYPREMAVGSASAVPTSADGKSIVFAGGLTEPLPATIALRLLPVSSEGPGAITPKKPPSAIALLGRLSDLVTVQRVADVIAISLPGVLLLWLVRRSSLPEASFPRRLSRAAFACIALFATAQLALGLQGFWLGLLRGSPLATLLSTGAAAACVAVVGGILPRGLLAPRDPDKGATGTLGNAGPAVALLIGLSILLSLLFGSTPPDRWTVVAAISVALLYAGLRGFALCVAPDDGGAKVRGWLALALAFAAMFASAADPRWPVLGPIVRVVVCALIGASMLGALVDLAGRTLRPEAGLDPARRSWGRRAVVGLVLVVAAIPISRIPGLGGDLAAHGAMPRDLGLFALSLARTGARLVAVGAALCLAHAGAAGRRLDPVTRGAVVLGTATLAFDAHEMFCYVPITFLLGWGVLRSIVVEPPADLDARDLPPAQGGRAAEPLDEIVHLNAAERGYGQLRDNLLERLSRGEIGLEEYNATLSRERRVLDEMRERSRVGDRALRDVALAYGPFDTAWKNALHGARWAVLLASPLIFLSLRSILLADYTGQVFPHWIMGYKAVGAIARWALIGLFFGGLFPYLRGRGGLGKSFWVFLAILVPALPSAGVFWATPDELRGTAFFSAQLFLVCTLLGLVAFDYVTISRRGLRGLRALFHVYNLPSIGLSLSTITVAAGTSVSTLLSSDAGAIVTAALGFVIGGGAGIEASPGGGP